MKNDKLDIKMVIKTGSIILCVVTIIILAIVLIALFATPANPQADSFTLDDTGRYVLYNEGAPTAEGYVNQEARATAQANSSKTENTADGKTNEYYEGEASAEQINIEDLNDVSFKGNGSGPAQIELLGVNVEGGSETPRDASKDEIAFGLYDMANSTIKINSEEGGENPISEPEQQDNEASNAENAEEQSKTNERILVLTDLGGQVTVPQGENTAETEAQGKDNTDNGESDGTQNSQPDHGQASNQAAESKPENEVTPEVDASIGGERETKLKAAEMNLEILEPEETVNVVGVSDCLESDTEHVVRPKTDVLEKRCCTNVKYAIRRSCHYI